jgi:hypothetical protein
MAPSYWGGWFPEPSDGALSYWGGWFPEGEDDPGYGDPGVAAFEIALDKGAALTLTWETHIDKARDGLERRTSVLDRPIQRYAGPMLLVGDQRKVTRTQLAQYAHAGLSFLIGLTYEAIAILDVPNGDIITVPSTASLDWANVGQRVIVDKRGVGAFVGVITAVTSTTLDLFVADYDANLFARVASPGGRVMPAMSSLLDPQQVSTRLSLPPQRWR